MYFYFCLPGFMILKGEVGVKCRLHSATRGRQSVGGPKIIFLYKICGCNIISEKEKRGF